MANAGCHELRQAIGGAGKWGCHESFPADGTVGWLSSRREQPREPDPGRGKGRVCFDYDDGDDDDDEEIGAEARRPWRILMRCCTEDRPIFVLLSPRTTDWSSDYGWPPEYGIPRIPGLRVILGAIGIYKCSGVLGLPG